MLSGGARASGGGAVVGSSATAMRSWIVSDGGVVLSVVTSRG